MVPISLKKQYRRICELFNKGVFPRAYKNENLKKIKDSLYSDLEFKCQHGKNTKGKLCYAGVDMVDIFFDGSVWRCFFGDVGTVWQLVKGDVGLYSGPEPCFSKTCQCPAHMIGLKRFRDAYELSSEFIDHYEKRKCTYA